MSNAQQKSFLEICFDTACVASIIGIYPRYIEPRLLFTTKRRIPIPNLPPQFDNVKIVFISDLHINKHLSYAFIARIIKKIASIQPDLIIFGGDLLTYARYDEEKKLIAFLSGLKAPLGVFSCLGNHDYSQYATLEKNGSVIVEEHPPEPIMQGFRRLFSCKIDPKEHICSHPILPHETVSSMYKKYDIALLHNATTQVERRNSLLNITGLGDIMCGHLDTHKAFRKYDIRFPGIIFAHNPDSYMSLSSYPGDLFLFGHTHGGQVNIPLLWEKITPMKDVSLKNGLYMRDGRAIFVSRGLGATFPFRFCAPPQIAVLQLVKEAALRVREPHRLFQPLQSPSSLVTGRLLNDDPSS